MSTALEGCYPPIARDNSLERLVVLDIAEEDVPERIWDIVHAEVQQVLGGLDDEVRRRVPLVNVAGGRSAGRAFPLFSYRTYHSPETSDVDAVVAGVDFLFTDGGIAVQGDVSGEQGGDVIHSVSVEMCGTNGEQLIAAAKRVAGQLRRAGQQIAEALVSPSRRVG